MKNGTVLFQISQSGIIGQVNQNNSNKNEYQVIKQNDNLVIQSNRFIKGEYQKEDLVTHNLNLNKIYLCKFNLQNYQKNIYQLDNQQNHFNNFNQILNGLTPNEILSLSVRITRQFLLLTDFEDKIFQLGQKTFLQKNQEIIKDLGQGAIDLCILIQGKTKKVIAEKADYNNSGLELRYSYGQGTDFGSTGYGQNLIPYDKVQFQTTQQQVKLAEFQIQSTERNYLKFTGQIRKNMDILQQFPDAQVEITYYNNQTKLNTDISNVQSAFAYFDLELLSKIPNNATSAICTLFCKNSTTVPGNLEVKNFQLYYQPNNYKTDIPQNQIAKIQKGGIETRKYIEQIGFNPRDLEDYKKEYHQKLNLFRNTNLPVVVQEPVKFFNEIIDDNKLRTVVKQQNTNYKLNLAKTKFSPHKQYLIGMWIRDRNKDSIIQLNCNISQPVKQMQSNQIKNSNTEITLDKAITFDDNFYFYYGFVYPYGMRNRNSEENIQLLNKIDKSLSEISTDHKAGQDNQERAVICTKNDQSNHEITLSVNISGQKPVNTAIIMPIIKELSITQMDIGQLVQMSANRANEYL